MPLLGRHKSLPGGANQAKSEQQQPQQPAPLLCESPLFGTRRQLPIVTQSAALSEPQSIVTTSKQRQAASQPTASSKRQSLSAPNSSNAAAAAAATTTTTSAAETQFGSIPKQISRQQIHYAFSIMDTNSDGLIDLRDLSQMLANLGVPIDEAILSHVMSSVVSKRGDHRISEREFLEWIGKFVQVSDLHAPSEQATIFAASSDRSTACKSISSPSASTPQQLHGNLIATSAGRLSNPLVRSASSTSALVAQSIETQQLISEQLSKRRGSGSGLALMRSLSSTNAAAASGSKQFECSSSSTFKTTSKRDKVDTLDEASQVALAAAAAAAAAAEQQREAQNDLKAAFCVFDLDGDGFITLDEVQQGLKLLGESWSLAELDQLLFSKCEQQQQASRAGGAKKAPSGAARNQPQPQQQQRISIDDFVKLLL